MKTRENLHYFSLDDKPQRERARRDFLEGELKGMETVLHDNQQLRRGLDSLRAGKSAL